MTENHAPYGNFSPEKATPLQRVLHSAGCRTYAELAEFLNIRRSSIAKVRESSRIPDEWLVKLLRLNNVNPDWIVTGLGPRYLGPANNQPATHIVYHTHARPPKECTAQELFTELVRRALIDL